MVRYTEHIVFLSSSFLVFRPPLTQGKKAIEGFFYITAAHFKARILLVGLVFIRVELGLI